jgi:ATP-dependent helicase/nuclease subunit B
LKQPLCKIFDPGKGCVNLRSDTVMNAVLGPFFHLEGALTDAVHRHKSKAALAPLLILVPSDSLRRRLKVCLALENRMNLLNVYLLTFHQLYLRLFEESRLDAPLPADDSIIEAALSQWMKTAGSEAEAFLTVAENAGGCGALWQTLRDLKDGGVNPAVLLQAVEENLFDARDKEKLGRLVRLHTGFSNRCQQWGLHDYADFIISVTGCVRTSRFLRQFKRVFYYGFYELTQIQLDVYHELARRYDATLFFPLMRGHPGWVFAQRFYERHLQGLVTEEEDLCRSAGDSHALTLFEDEVASRALQPRKQPTCTVFSCSAPRDEILTVAKEILRLNADQGMPLTAIGVVARTLEPYGDAIKEVFRDHCIPISTSVQEPLIQAPLTKSVILLVNLAGKDYLRSHFVDLVSSPDFNFGAVLPKGVMPRPDLWDVLTRRLGITKGAEQWGRLKRYLDRDLEFAATAEEGEESPRVSIASEQVGLLWRVFSELHHDLSALRTEASWNRHVRAWKSLLQKYLNLGDPGAGADDSPDEALKRTIAETLNSISALDSIGSTPSLPVFVRTLQRCLESKSVPISNENIAGVAVLDAMASRGSQYRTLFLLGLNEGLFPRTIREDAFLRDRTRRVMDTSLGYKVSEKLAAYDEEKLLFTLLVESASERLYALYHRSDENGAALEPSWYVTELKRIFSAETITIPRSITAKTDFEPFRRSDLLLPEELAICLSLKNHNVERLLQNFPETEALYRRGKKLLHVIENAAGELSEYDGITGYLPDYWERFSSDGVAPTSLERYARCPFQFFALNVLKLRTLERPEDESVLGASDIGQIIHRILRDFFQELIDRGYFNRAKVSIASEALLEATAEKVFREYEAENPTGYPLVWEILQQTITALLRQLVARELQELLQSGRRALTLETELKSCLPASWPEPAASLALRGTIDRIDWDPTANRWLVIDYKYKSGRRPSSADIDLLRAAVRGEKLQPPLYALLAREYGRPHQTAATTDVVLYYLAPNWAEGPFLKKLFSADHWDGPLGQCLSDTISYFIEGIHQGRYFIHPGPPCEYCEVAQACRKDHLPTAWRTANDPLTVRYFDLVKKNAPQDIDE